MKTQIESLKERALAACNGASDVQALQEARVKFLGKKGELTALLRNMGNLPPEERPLVGKLVNEVRDQLEQAWKQKETDLAASKLQAQLEAETLDITLPGRKPRKGTYHPLTLVLNEIKSVFISMGYQVVEGPEIESDYYNFEALNIPKDHPARDMQDTFYLTEHLLLRSQTSPVQIRTMERQQPPVRIIAPGKVYRSDADVTHSPMFHQVEGLLVDKGITMADLKGTLQLFAEKLFGPDTKTRFRPSYFPFTEPSAEVDVSCIICKGQGCRVCSDTGWLEILGCGMVDPRVLAGVGYDPEEVSGFAFGMGIERIAMLKYGINDIRLFFENDLRFLKQF
ncbi:MAG: phenylalanine--tRNA ligase subunit alpha [Firmicutes bacterium]|nr:phenylalanine--tRNA ligase subunit alpha [Bacillota bacterium]